VTGAEVGTLVLCESEVGAWVDYSDCASDWHREIDPQVLMAACPKCGSEDR
jgi:hypothetical protein